MHKSKVPNLKNAKKPPGNCQRRVSSKRFELFFNDLEHRYRQYLLYDESVQSTKPREALESKHYYHACHAKNEHLIKIMIKQIIYKQAVKVLSSKERILIFSFLQLSDFNKLIKDQIKIMLMNEQLDQMN